MRLSRYGPKRRTHDKRVSTSLDTNGLEESPLPEIQLHQHAIGVAGKDLAQAESDHVISEMLHTRSLQLAQYAGMVIAVEGDMVDHRAARFGRRRHLDVPGIEHSSPPDVQRRRAAIV